MSDHDAKTKADGAESASTAGLGALKVGADNTATYGHDGKPWPQTMDANAWAAEFCKRNSASDHAAMLGWFANAIMAGHDTALRDRESADAEAARYRWLRNVNTDSQIIVRGWNLHGANLDTEIDAAMTETPNRDS